MAQNTHIEWCHDTLNLWWGCTKASDGCKFCYAEHLADQRYHKGNFGPKGVRQEVKSWRSTLNNISKLAKETGVRRRVFCQSMSDTFEGPETMGGAGSENWKTTSRLRLELMMAIQDHPELDFLLLTKRPENAAMFFAQKHDGKGILDICGNIWIGTSVEDQKTADERIPHLLQIPAKVRFLSCEPLLGPIDISSFLYMSGDMGEPAPLLYPKSHLVIGGGESGPNARPMHPAWPRSLRDQCVAAGVPFFFKQWGEYHPRLRNGAWPDGSKQSDGCCDHLPGVHLYRDGTRAGELGTASKDEAPVNMKRVGKHRAGRLLDGCEWSELPVVAQ